MNQSTIFELQKKEPVVINCASRDTWLFVTNGFQSSKKLKLKYQPGTNYFFQANAVIDNAGIFTAISISILLFIAYIFSGVKLLMILANIPVLALLYVLFIHPGNSIVLKPWQPGPTKIKNKKQETSV